MTPLTPSQKSDRRSLRWGWGVSLTRGVSVSLRIAFAIFIILTSVSACFLYNAYTQNQLVLLTYETLDARVPAMLAATRLKNNLLAHDDVLFRFLATHDDAHLNELQTLQIAARAEISTLSKLTRSEVVHSQLRMIGLECEHYFSDTGHLLDFSKKSQIPKNVGFFGAAALVREEAAQRRELDLLSTEGETRLTRLFGLCDEIVNLNRLELERAHTDMYTMLSESSRAVFLATVITAVITLMVGFWLGLSLIVPLKSLLRGIERAEGGDYSVEIPTASNPHDELSRVTSAFNRMMRTIHEQRQRLLDETIRDGMTGLVNHRHFRVLLKSEIERAGRTGYPISLLMIDVDYFKTYNDSQGHEFGNELLKGICHILKENLRDMDTLARYGGDELSVILPQMGASEATVLGERLRQATAAGRFPGSEVFPKGHLTISIGGASFPENGLSASDLIIKADAALYLAKTQGRDALRWSEAIVASNG